MGNREQLGRLERLEEGDPAGSMSISIEKLIAELDQAIALIAGTRPVQRQSSQTARNGPPSTIRRHTMSRLASAPGAMWSKFWMTAR